MYMCTYRNSIIIKHIKAKQTIIHKNKLQTYYMYKDMKKKKCSVFQQAENLWFVAATTFGLWTRVITVTTFRPSSLTSHLSSSSLLATAYHLPSLLATAYHLPSLLATSYHLPSLLHCLPSTKNTTQKVTTSSGHRWRHSMRCQIKSYAASWVSEGK